MTIITQSSIKRLDTCERLYYFADVLGLQKIKPESDAENITRYEGTLFHDFMATGILPEITDGHTAKSVGMCRAYMAQYGFRPVGDPEVLKTIPVLTPKGRASKFAFGGKIDLIAESNFHEFKTAGSIDANYINKLDLDFQVVYYSILTGMSDAVYDVIRNPKIKWLEEKETLEQYADRCFDNLMKEPAKSFFRVNVAISERKRGVIADYMREALKRLKRVRRTQGNCNFNACWNQYQRACRYAQICTSEDPQYMRETYYQIDANSINKELNNAD